MENELDLTLRLGLLNPTVETHLSLNTPTTDQEINVDGCHGDNNDGCHGDNNDGCHGDNNDGGKIFSHWGELIDDDEGARNNVNVNIRVYNHIFQYFAGVGETLNFSPYPMPPAPETATGNDYVLIDVPARRSRRNNSLAIGSDLDENANVKRRRGSGGCYGGTNKCTNRNCKASSSPMWRRGPLGPKTLCNACGIKFRKEEEKRSKRN